MDINAEELKKRAQNALKSAKESRFARATSKLSTELLEKIKNKANNAATTVSRGTRNFDFFPPPARTQGTTHGSAASNAGRPSQQDTKQERQINRLCALGFSVAAVRYALMRCEGNVQEAGAFLLLEENQKEIRAAELAAQQEEPLGVGCTARVSNLRGATQLNGALVVLREFDADSQRWVVELEDGSMKSVLPSKLDLVSGPQVQPADDDEAAALRNHVRRLLGNQGPEVEETLNALSAQELREAISSINVGRSEGADKDTGVSVQQTTTAAYQQSSHPPSAPSASSARSETADGNKVGDYSHTESTGVPAENAALTLAKQAAEAAAAAEVRERKDAELLKAEQQRLEAELERQQARLKEREAQLLEEAAQHKKALELSEQRMREAEECSKEQQKELERLQVQAQDKKVEMDRLQESSRNAAEDRELRLLEQEAEQLRIGQMLQEERTRIEQQRNSVMSLQKIICETAGIHSKGVEFSLDDQGGAAEQENDEGQNGDSAEEEVYDVDWNNLNFSSTPKASRSKSGDHTDEETEKEVLQKKDADNTNEKTVVDVAESSSSASPRLTQKEPSEGSTSASPKLTQEESPEGSTSASPKLTQEESPEVKADANSDAQSSKQLSSKPSDKTEAASKDEGQVTHDSGKAKADVKEST